MKDSTSLVLEVSIISEKTIVQICLFMFISSTLAQINTSIHPLVMKFGKHFFNSCRK